MLSVLLLTCSIIQNAVNNGMTNHVVKAASHYRACSIDNSHYIESLLHIHPLQQQFSLTCCNAVSFPTPARMTMTMMMIASIYPAPLIPLRWCRRPLANEPRSYTVNQHQSIIPSLENGIKAWRTTALPCI